MGLIECVRGSTSENAERSCQQYLHILVCPSFPGWCFWFLRLGMKTVSFSHHHQPSKSKCPSRWRVRSPPCRGERNSTELAQAQEASWTGWLLLGTFFDRSEGSSKRVLRFGTFLGAFVGESHTGLNRSQLSALSEHLSYAATLHYITSWNQPHDKGKFNTTPNLVSNFNTKMLLEL